nr:retrovirus-related Pol polyprotein from transposon TNT 1-94 [Tanacetum cinerariifolium]
MRIEQYFLMTDYLLWEVILNGDLPAPTQIIEGVLQLVAPTTAEQKLARKNKLKSRGTLLMALPEKHYLKFNSHKDAKILMEAIEKRFEGNIETKKVQKTLLKQQYENFTGSSSESLDQIHDKLQKLVSQLEIHEVSLFQEDVNLKFLQSLPSEWKTHTLIWRNKADLVEQSLDDLFNRLKIYEAEMAMLTMRARRFLQRTGRNLRANGPTFLGFDMSKVECYNFHKKGHFARECRSPKDSRRNGAAEPQRRSVPVETSTSNALVSQCDGVGSYDWSFQAEEEPANYTLMAFSSLSSSFNKEVLSCSKACSKAYAYLHSQYDKLTADFCKSQFDVISYQTGLESVKARLLVYKQNESIFEEDIKLLKLESNESWPPSSLYDRFQPSDGYHVVPSSYTGTFMPPKPDLVFNIASIVVETGHLAFNVQLSPTKPAQDLSHTNRPTAPIIEDWVSNSEDESETKAPQIVPSFVQSTEQGNPQHALKDKGVIDSRCSRNITGNMSYLFYFEELNGGYVAFGGHPKGVLLRVPRENNMYNVNLKNIVTSGDLTCLFAKATIDESNLWHRRLGHINFKTMNKLVKGNLVRGLPTKVFENDNTCVACKKGKQHRASCKTKPVSSVDQPLYRLHIDLFVSTFVQSVNKKSYCLVVTDDYSRFTWVFFLATKDETSPILKTFITGLENQLSLKVKVIRSDNGTEFKNNDLNQFCGMKRIKREFSVPRTPQQNDITERKNRTLIEVARTMLADSLLPIPFWAEAVNTACYVQNMVLVTKPPNKTPYELLHGRTPSIGFIRPFGCLVTILNTLDALGKFEGKVDEGFLVGYSVSSKAFRVFNSITRIVQETLHVNFLENKPNITEKVGEESDQQYVLFPMWSSGSTNPQNNDGDAAFVKEEPKFNAKKPESEVNIFPSSSAQSKKQDDKTKREAKGKSPVDTNTCSAAGNTFSAAGNTFSVVGPSNAAASPTHGKSSFIDASQLPDDPDMPKLEDTTYSDDEDNEEGIDYEKVFAPVARIEGIRLFLAYASFMGFIVYQMDVKSAFLYGAIEEEVYVCQPSGFEDPNHSDKVYKVVKALYGLHQAPRAWKFRLTEGKSSSTPIDTENTLLKDPDGEDVDVHTYGSMIGSLMYLTSSRPNIMFAVCAYAYFQVTPKASHLYVVKRIFRYLKGKPYLGLWYPTDLPFDLVAYSDSDYAGASLDRKSTTGGYQFLGCRLISWQCKKQTVVATSSTEAEYVAATSCCTQVLWIQNQLLDYGDLPLLGVNTPRCDDDRLELMELTVFLLPKVEKIGIRVSAVDLQVSAVRHMLLLLVQKLPLYSLTNWCCSLSAVRSSS